MSSLAKRGSWPRRALAVAGSAVLMVGVGVVTAPAAFAADPDTSASHASAQYLSGTWNTAGATADYTGNGTETPDPAVTDSNDIASLVSTIPGLEINGAFGNEYAHADTGGSSWAASGRITGAGGVGAAAPANVDIDLGALLAAAGIPNNIVEKMQLSLQEVSSIAKLDVASLGSNAPADDCGDDWSTATNCRDYALKSGTLHIESSALKAVMDQIQTLAGQIDAAIGSVTVALPTSIADAVLDPFQHALDPVVGTHLDLRFFGYGNVYDVIAASLSDPSLAVTLSGSVVSALATILGQPHTVNGVTLQLADGIIDVDWDTALGGLKNLPPNSPLFGVAVVNSIKTSLNQIVDDIAAELPGDIETILKAINVQIGGSVDALVATTVTNTAQGPCTQWIIKDVWCKTPGPDVVTTTDYPLHGVLSVNYNGPASPDPATLWDLLHAQGSVGFALDWDSTELAAMPVLLRGMVNSATAFFNATSPWSLSALGLDTAAGAAVDAAIQAVVDALADGAKSLGGAAIDQIAGILNSASSVFGGTINKQVDDGDGTYSVSALELRFGSAAPLRSGSAFKAAPRPAAIALPPVTVRLATSTVGQNRPSTPCVVGTHYDPKTGTCVKDSTPGGGGSVPGGGGTPTTTAPPTTTTTEPTTEVLGTGDTVSPQSPEVEVAGESDEVTETEVLGLAETGPRELGIITLLGLELLLGGVAVTRLTARRRRAAHDQHHV